MKKLADIDIDLQEYIEQLEKEGPVDYKYAKSLFCEAIEAREIYQLQYLLEKFPKLCDDTYDRNKNALHKVCECFSTCGPAIEWNIFIALYNHLINKGIDIKATDTDSYSPLYYLHAFFLDNLIANKHIGLDFKDALGRTLLHLVVLCNHKEALIDVLLIQGVDPSIKDNMGRTAVDLYRLKTGLHANEEHNDAIYRTLQEALRQAVRNKQGKEDEFLSPDGHAMKYLTERLVELTSKLDLNSTELQRLTKANSDLAQKLGASQEQVHQLQTELLRQNSAAKALPAVDENTKNVSKFFSGFKPNT